MSGSIEGTRDTSNTLDYYGGSLMMIVGASAIFKGFDYHVGTLAQMGSGFFPVGVGAVMALMGLLILLGARRRPTARVSSKKGKVEWRGWICIVLAYVAFVLIGRFGGLVPATFAVTFISALGDRSNTFRSAFVLSTTMTVVSVVVFSWILQMQFPLFRWG